MGVTNYILTGMILQVVSNLQTKTPAQLQEVQETTDQLSIDTEEEKVWSWNFGKISESCWIWRCHECVQFKKWNMNSDSSGPPVLGQRPAYRRPKTAEQRGISTQMTDPWFSKKSVGNFLLHMFFFIFISYLGKSSNLTSIF